MDPRQHSLVVPEDRVLADAFQGRPLVVERSTNCAGGPDREDVNGRRESFMQSLDGHAPVRTGIAVGQLVDDYQSRHRRS